MTWRTKTMPNDEWAALREHFEHWQMVSGAPPNLAMFLKRPAGEPEGTVYMTGAGIDGIEARSPGVWKDSEAPSGPDVMLLVGEGDPWKYFSIEKPAR